jgi:hypothetical protein
MGLMAMLSGGSLAKQHHASAEEEPLLQDKEPHMEHDPTTITTDVPASYHQFVACMTTHSDTSLPRVLWMLFFSYLLITLQLIGLFAVVVAASGQYDHDNLIQVWTRASDVVRGLKWYDVVMNALVIIIVGLTVSRELHEIHFMRFWPMVNKTPTGLRHTFVACMLWSLSAIRMFLLVPTVLAVVPMIVFDEGADAKSLAMEALALLFILDVDDLWFTHGIPAAWREQLPKTIQLDKEERVLFNHAHYAYIVGTALSAVIPTWVIIYFLAPNSPEFNRTLSSVRWLCLEESAQMIFLAITHVRFWKLFVDYRNQGCGQSGMYRLGRVFLVVPEWLFARLTLLPVLAELVLYGCTNEDKSAPDYVPRTQKQLEACANHETLQYLLDPWYYLSYITMSQWQMKLLTGSDFGTLELMRWVPLSYVAFMVIGALSATPALCSWKTFEKSFGKFGNVIAHHQKEDPKV